MNIGELIQELQKLDPSLPVTYVYDDFPRTIGSVEVEKATKPYSERRDGAGYWYQSYYPECEDVPVYDIAVLRCVRQS